MDAMFATKMAVSITLSCAMTKIAPAKSTMKIA
jgi:hypothetical protein